MPLSGLEREEIRQIVRDISYRNFDELDARITNIIVEIDAIWNCLDELLKEKEE